MFNQILVQFSCKSNACPRFDLLHVPVFKIPSPLGLCAIFIFPHPKMTNSLCCCTPALSLSRITDGPFIRHAQGTNN